jgi:murein DD-endopeptidase MepM/ murein hydrolase activator NlpD
MYSYRGICARGVALLAASLVTSLLVAAGSAGPGAADPRDDKKKIDAEVAKASSILEGATSRAKEAAMRLAAANGALPAAQNLVAERRGQVVAAQVVAETARRKLAEAQAAVADAQGRYAAADETLQRGRARVAEFVSAAYMGSDLQNLNVLMGASGPLDAFERYGYIDRVVATERDAVRGYLGALTAAKEVENEATLAQRAADRARLEADATVADAKVAQTQAEAAAADVAALVAERADALSMAEEEKAESLQRYEEAKAEAARIANALADWERQQQAAEPPAAAGAARAPQMKPGAKFLMPVQGWKSSDFGNRYDPYYNVWQLHAGVDIAADGGQPIYAAAAGKVIWASWNGGYGNYTCISHGRLNGQGLSTCYAHQSRILVSEGQQVRRGQVIGRVGTTGASTGDHLHFEVRLDGQPVQPLRYLPGCLC